MKTKAPPPIWIIDLDCPGESDKSHTAYGPFASQSKIENQKSKIA